LINRNRWVTNVLERDTQIDGTSAYALQLTQASPGLVDTDAVTLVRARKKADHGRSPVRAKRNRRSTWDA
jgi:hypothetical protein